MKHSVWTRLLGLTAAVCMTAMLLSGCAKKKESVVIYTSAEDYRVEYLQQKLSEQFPDYEVRIEYMSTGNHAAKLTAEGTDTECDITYDLEYGYLEQLAADGVLTDLSGMYDRSVFTDDAAVSNYFLPELRNGGAIILNTEVLAAKGLAVPASYEDLLDPQYKGLISMPNPKSSGTGYMFLKNLVNAWGEDKAFAYFDQLTENILQYTSSGSGPVNALVAGEAAIGLGMTSQAVTQINEGAPLSIVFFAEGSPYSMYGQAIIAGKDAKPAVKAVFDYMIHTHVYENCERFYPEQIFKDVTYSVEHYPENIVYGDMSNNTLAEKERLLEKWAY